MSKIYESVLDLIGNTPLMRVRRLQKILNKNSADILIKLEMFNPGGSVKDRPAKEMIMKAIEQGLIDQETIIIEPTSGSTGIGLASVCNSLGLKTIIVMPENMSVERVKLIEAYGAEVILTNAEKGMKGSLEKVEELKQKYNKYFIPSQFSNINNPLAHYHTTANEIINDTNGRIDFFIAGIGTGGTISGTAKRLKEYNSNIKIIGVEPSDSPLITKGKSGVHKLQGIGANFIPENLDLDLVDEVLTITTEEAYEACRALSKYEGLLVGISSGACLAAALKLSENIENEGKVFVCLMPDTGERYLSTDLFKK